MLHWRRLDRHETDHEMIWLFVTLGCAAGVTFWIAMGLPTPRCTFHALTGIPCPTCGGTRCVRLLADGDWAQAFFFNPLLFLGVVGATFYNLYAAIVLAGRLPRLRVKALSPRVGSLVRYGALAAFFGNWAWLIAAGV